MPNSSREIRRALLESWFAQAIAAVDGGRSLRRALDATSRPAQAPAIIAVGKAAPAMAKASHAWLQQHGISTARGLVISHHDCHPPGPQFEMLRGDHPDPGPASHHAAERLGAFVTALPDGLPVWLLLSGGTSALIAAPRDGMSEPDLRDKLTTLHRRGLDIVEMNAERRRLMRWGGGRLADALEGHEVAAWVVSDVIGNDLATIGSGPLIRHPGDAAIPHRIVADGKMAAVAACEAARRDGVDAIAHPEPISGDAATAGRKLAHWISNELDNAPGQPAVLHAWYGETTVSLPTDHGRGGRAQQMALAAVQALDGSTSVDDVMLLVAGTDGRDGPTDAAGAIVDGETLTALGEAQTDIGEVLARADSHPALDSVGALFRPGATSTNVADLVLVLLRHR